MHKMWTNYPQLEKELAQVQKLMQESIKLKNPNVSQAILEMMNAGGKMLRPAYQLMFSNFGKKQDQRKKLSLAASVEMLHTATLIHDDIVDMAATRRGVETIAHRFGNDVAVYAGDYLFASVFKLMSRYSTDMRVLQVNARAMEKILSGELGQMNMRYNLEQTVDNYVENISGKTAELFALSCFIGAYEADSSKLVSKYAMDIGRNIGLAFQVIDDLLDYTVEENAFGKPVLEDMKQGVYSLPLLLALEEKKEELAPLLQKGLEMTDEDIEKVLAIMNQTQAIERTKELAESFTKKALNGILRLPKTKENTREKLYEITKGILMRKN